MQKQDKVSRLAALAEIERVKEMQRRKRISDANRGRQPWNKGRRHSPETIAKIRAGTVKAMARPEVRAKLEAYNENQRKPHDEATKASHLCPSSRAHGLSPSRFCQDGGVPAGEKIRRILRERSASTRATITAQCRVVLERMAGCEDPQMREAARFEGALDVLGTVSWNFVKKDWDQLVLRWEENPEFRERAVQRILSRMCRPPGEPKKRAGNKMKVALDTFEKLKEARGRLEQAQAAVAKLGQVKIALAHDPERQAKALAAELQAAEVLEKLHSQVDNLTLAMGPLAQYLSIDEVGDTAAAAAAQQAQQAEHGEAQAQAQQGLFGGSAAALPGHGGGGSGSSTVGGHQGADTLSGVPAKAGAWDHSQQQQQHQQQWEQPQVQVNGTHAAVNGTVTGKPLLGHAMHAMPAAPAAIPTLAATPKQGSLGGDQRHEADESRQPPPQQQQQQHAKEQQGFGTSLHHGHQGGQGATAAEVRCSGESLKEAAAEPPQAKLAEPDDRAGPAVTGNVDLDVARSAVGGDGGSATAQTGLEGHGQWLAVQSTSPAAAAADPAVQPLAMQLPRLQPRLLPQLAATAAVAGAAAPAVELGSATSQRPAGPGRERELVTAGSTVIPSTAMPVSTPAVSLARAQYWHFSMVAGAANGEQRQQHAGHGSSSLSVATPPAEAATSEELLSHEQVLKVAEQLNDVLRQHGNPSVGLPLCDSGGVARPAPSADAALEDWLLCGSSAAAAAPPEAAEAAEGAAAAAAAATQAVPAGCDVTGAAGPRGRGRPRKDQGLSPDPSAAAEAERQQQQPQQRDAEQGAGAAGAVGAPAATLGRGRGRPRRGSGPDHAAPDEQQQQHEQQHQYDAPGSLLSALPLPHRRPSRLHPPAHRQALHLQPNGELPGWADHASDAVGSSAANGFAAAVAHSAAPSVPAGRAAAMQENTAAAGRAAAEQEAVATAAPSAASSCCADGNPAPAARRRGRPSKAEAAARQQETDFAVALEAASVVAVLEGRASALHKSVMSGLREGSLDWPRLLQEMKQQQEAVQRRGVPVPLFPTASEALGKLREELPRLEQSRKGVEEAVVVLLREVGSAREARLGESGPVGVYPRRVQAGGGVGRRRLPWQHQ
ncbi:hypothetical protein N2152v2_010370 [Parachlorella kessleri]